MKVSWNWLRELVKLDEGIGPYEAALRLAAVGVAVDAVTPVGVGLSGVVVAEIRGKRPHPKADKLTLVDVFDGKEVTQVVCGAPNVPEPGASGNSPRVAWARPGARLPSGLSLSVREVRGIASPGMLCAEDELGLSTDHGGILLLEAADGVDIGSDFATAVGLPDHILELDITANRPDLLGHVGVARELAAIYRQDGARLTLPDPDLVRFSHERKATQAATIVIADEAACPRYLGHVLIGMRVAKSPLKQRLLLSRLGSRSISNLVDATNLALLAFGQPLHAFDLNRLSGHKVIVRRARAGESLQTLDGATRTLAPDDLVIADAEGPVALAGVLGGQDSEVKSDTTDVLLESAYFDPSSIRRTARRHKLHTEASHRFERGVDPNAGLDRAARYCLQLMLEQGGGQLLHGCIDVYPHSKNPKVIELRPARTSQILGIDVSAPRQAEHLTALGLAVDAHNHSTLAVTVPTFRPDLLREIDLIEEVGRLCGYDNVPPRLPALRMSRSPESWFDLARRHNAERARDLCAALGLDEVQLFSMTGPDKLHQVAGVASRPPLLLENPLREELSALRTQLLPGLLEALSGNLNRGTSDVRLFEVGEVFFGRGAAELPEERCRVASVLCGHRPAFLRTSPADALDVADVRGLVEELLSGLGYVLVESARSEAGTTANQVLIRPAKPEETPWLHPGVAAVLVATASGQILGDFGEVHPDLRQRLEIAVPAFCFELDISPQLSQKPARLYQAPSRFPAVTRDLSFFLDKDTPAGAVFAALHHAGEPLLLHSQVLEDYREPGKVPPNKKGLLFGLMYRSDERTLTDEEVQKAHDRVVAHLQRTLPIQLR